MKSLNAVDILVERTDPLIGSRLSAAAEQRNPRFPKLLVGAYAKRFASFAGINELDLFGEKVYIILSLTAKSSLAWLVFGGTYRF